MTVHRLFSKRVRVFWQKNIEAWRLIIDWTVAVYLLLPLLAAFIYNYVTYWTTSPDWFELFTERFIILLMFVTVWGGQLRSFLEAGDQLFLRQKTAWMRGLKLRGVIYSALTTVVRIALPIVVLLPILWQELQWTINQLGALFVFSIVYKLAILLAKQKIAHKFVRIKRFLALVLLCLISAIIYFIILGQWLAAPLLLSVFSIALALVLIYQLHLYIRQGEHFLVDVETEQKMHDKTLSFVINQTGLTKKNSMIKLTTPLIFRNSKPWYKKRTAVNVLSELHFKTFFRRWSMVSVYMHYISITIFAIAIVRPLWLKGTMWLVGYILLIVWLRTNWVQFIISPYVKMLNFSFRQRLDAENKATLLLSVPALVILSIAALVLMFVF